MNAFEKTAQVGRELFEINAETLRKITELSAENFKRYLALNRDYLQKLPEVRELGSFVELQREYGESLWNGVQDDLKSRGEILREAVEGSGVALRDAFNSTADGATTAAASASGASKAA